MVGQYHRGGIAGRLHERCLPVSREGHDATGWHFDVQDWQIDHLHVDAQFLLTVFRFSRHVRDTTVRNVRADARSRHGHAVHGIGDRSTGGASAANLLTVRQVGPNVLIH